MVSCGMTTGTSQSNQSELVNPVLFSDVLSVPMLRVVDRANLTVMASGE